MHRVAGSSSRRFPTSLAPALAAAALAAALSSCGVADDHRTPSVVPTARADRSPLSPVVDNPYVALAQVKRTVYEGIEPDAEAPAGVKVRVESVVRDTAVLVAGMRVTAVDIVEYENGAIVERTIDYYAQDAQGTAYYVGEQVDEYEGGKLVGHHGQWMTGQQGATRGTFMPASPKVGDVFNQESAPGIAEDRSRVTAVGRTVTVPAGTFPDCVLTEDVDPLGRTSQQKVYAKGVGLIRELFPGGKTVDLVSFERSKRTSGEGR